MSEHDELLQRKLDELESGAPLERVLSSIPAEQVETIELLKLAAAVRATPHPRPLLAQARFSKEKTVPVRRVTQPVKRAGIPRWAPIGALGGVAALVLIIVAALLAFSVTGLVSAKSATLADVSGQVLVAGTDAGATWHSASSGERLHGGERIRTGDGASVTVVFPEGSRTTIQPGSDVTLSKLETAAGGVIHVAFTQRAGKSAHSVVPFGSKPSSFLVQTPSGTANVRGTRFNVSVGSAGASRFAVDSGKVLVANPLSDVLLTSGQATTGLPGLELDTPAYEFSVQGELTAMDGDQWTVAGVTFTKTDATTVLGDPQLNDLVSVEGRILDSGERVADTITAADDDDEYATYTGELSDNEGDRWVVGGLEFIVNEQTDHGEGLVLGATVRVIYTVLEDGSLQAWSIEALGDGGEPPQPEDEISLEFSPDEIEARACETQVVATGRLTNTGDTAVTNVTLDSMVVKGADYFTGLSIEPASFASIEPGQTVEFTNTLTLADAFKTAPEDSEVKVRVYVTSADGLVEALPARLTLTVVSTCEQTETPTESVTPTDEPTDDETDEEEIGGACSAEFQHPTGMKLAERYGVPYEEIMAWFCTQPHFGFGEIDLAYSLAEAKAGEITVEEIFAMKAGGMGWGNIKKEMEVKPHKPAVVDEGNPDETITTDKSNPGNNGNNGNNGNKNKDKEKPTRKPKK